MDIMNQKLHFVYVFLGLIHVFLLDNPLILHLILQVSEVWRSYELDMVNYQNKCRLIRGWDDLFTKVKEHINSVSAMKLSPYYKV